VRQPSSRGARPHTEHLDRAAHQR